MKEPQTPPCFSKSLFPLLLAQGDFGLFHSLINRINELFIILLWLISRLTCQDLNFPSLDPGYSEEGSFLHFTHTCFMWGRVSHSRLVDLGAGSPKTWQTVAEAKWSTFHCLCPCSLCVYRKDLNVNTTRNDKKHRFLLESLKNHFLPELFGIVHYFFVLY